MSRVYLTKGVGSFDSQTACVMAVAGYYSGEYGETKWGDRPICVADEIHSLAIRLNDSCCDAERDELCGDLWERVVGSWDDSPKVRAERLRLLRCAAFKWAIYALDAAQIKHELKPFSEYKTADAYANAAYAAAARAAYAATDAYAAAAAANAAAAAANAANAAARAAYAATDAYAAAAAANAAAAAANAANAAARAAYAADDASGRRKTLIELRQLILDIVAVGASDRDEFVPQRTQAEVVEFFRNKEA